MSTAPPETHGGRTALEVATSARVMQLAIRAQLLRDVTQLWPMLDRKRLDETWPGWIRAMSLLVRNYHGQSAQAAASSYRAAREQATHSPAPRSLIRLAPPVAGLARQGVRLLRPRPVPARHRAARTRRCPTTLGTAARITLDGARTTTLLTMQDDPVAVGWYRVTDDDPCAFCALLASRGLVYKAETVGFEAHNDCACYGMAAFSRDIELPKVAQEAAKVYRNRGKGPALKAFRKAWESRAGNA
jgi:hypothetical protein